MALALVNAIACATTFPHVRCSPRAQSRRDRVITTAVQGGPDALTDPQKLFLLTDPLALSQLHVQVWTSPTAHRTWFAACVPGAVRDRAELRAAS